MAIPPDLVELRRELRTPINHILGYCQILLNEEEMPEPILADLRHIHQGGKQLLELISRYLDEATFKTQNNWQQVQHELRTPVNHIIGYSELLIEQAAELGQRSVVTDLRKIRAAAQQWLQLIESHVLPDGSAEVPDEGAAVSAAAEARSAESNKESAEIDLVQDVLPASLLVVDDDQPSRELLARRLHRVGFHVATAANGREGLELVQSRSFDLLLVDCVMPELDGLELLTKLRAEKSMIELPIIMVTGRDSSADIVKALKFGANDYLTKPVDFDVALARLAAHLKLRRAQAELNQRIQETKRLAEDLQVRNEFIKQVFGRYVTDAVVQSVLETPQGLKLGGQRRPVSVLMCDLRGFTALAERLAPETVVELLNTYLGAMAGVVVQYRGVVDEFIGDAILAIFGAPLPCEDHAESAVACGLAMQIEMERVNRRLSRLRIPALEIGIGIHTGEVVVGNIGSDKRAKYGVVGANVNLAGRIQSVSVGGEVLVSEATSGALGSRLKTERSFTIAPKGTASPIKLFSAIGVKGQDHLDLPETDAHVPNPSVRVPVKCYVCSDTKLLAAKGFDAELGVVSMRSGFLKTSELLHSRCDLKLALVTAPEAPEELLYCKVMDDDPGEAGWPIRFTSPLPKSCKVEDF